MPERLTPVDILNTRFPRRVSGYGIPEVDEFVRRVASDLEATLAECANLRERIAAQERELTQYRALETTMRDALVMAQKAADETRAAARSQAAAQMTEANARLAEVNAQVERLHQERRRLIRDLQARLTSQMEWLTEEIETIPPSANETPSAEQVASVPPVAPKSAFSGTAPTTDYAPVYVVTETPSPAVYSDETDTVAP